MTHTNNFSGERLRIARMYRGISIAELKNAIDVSKQAISQFENGKANPGFETLFKIISYLGFPREFFYQRDEQQITVGNTYFRALLTTNKVELLSQKERTIMLSKIYYFLNKYIEFPKLNLPRIEYNSENIEEIAMQVRKYWGLGLEPIQNIVHLLEKNGLVVTSFFTDGKFIDAFSQRQIVNGIEYYFIILAKDKSSAVRRQFDAAHELGHVLFDNWSLDLEQVSREEFRQIENEANQFAAAFLLPKEAFLKDLIYPNKLEFYAELKKKWRVSISAMIVRAHQLKAISYNQYQYLMKQMAQKGWKTKEPLDNILQVSKPTVLKQAIEILIENKILTGEQILQQLSNNNLALSRKEVEMLLDLDEGTLANETQSGVVINLKENLNKEDSYE